MAERTAALLEAQRSQLTLLRAPLHTTKNFLTFACNGVLQGISDVARHPVVLFVMLPLLVLSTLISLFVVDDVAVVSFNQIDANGDGVVTKQEAASFFPQRYSVLVENLFMPANDGLSSEAFKVWWYANQESPLAHASLYNGDIWREIAFVVADILWWLALGVLSSVGLGTGMHSGLLFLFPHIYLTCAAADSCQSANFWTYPVNPIYGPRERTFHCVGSPEALGVGILARFLKVAPWCIVWGSGTAIGEIPPYALSYAAARQGKKQDDLEEVSKFDVVNRMKNWMLEKIQRYGFWAILALAAWPNMAFDLCGMACGQFLMPFWTFFGATLIGKAFIKVNMQAVFFVLLFSGDNIESLLSSVAALVASVLPFGVVGDAMNKAISAIHATREKIGARARGEVAVEQEQQANLVQFVMQTFVVLMVGWFAKSIVDTFAQQQQEVYDADTVERVKRLLETRDGDDVKDDELLEMIDKCSDYGTTNAANGVFAVLGLSVLTFGAMQGDQGAQVCGGVALLEAIVVAALVDPRKEGSKGFLMALGMRLIVFCAIIVALTTI